MSNIASTANTANSIDVLYNASDKQKEQMRKLITAKPTALAQEFIPQLVPIQDISYTEQPLFEALKLGVPLSKWIVMKSTKFKLFHPYVYHIPTNVYPDCRLFLQSIRTSKTRLIADATGNERIAIREALSFKLHLTAVAVEQYASTMARLMDTGEVDTRPSVLDIIGMPYWLLIIKVSPEDMIRKATSQVGKTPDVSAIVELLNTDSTAKQIAESKSTKLANRIMGTAPLARSVSIADAVSSLELPDSIDLNDGDLNGYISTDAEP